MKSVINSNYLLETKNNEMSETAEHNPDFNAYLTISERSCHLYGDVQYDKAEERKSVSLHSQIYDTSVSDKSGGSDDYLTPTVKTVKENTTGSLSSEGYDDVITSSSQTRI